MRLYYGRRSISTNQRSCIYQNQTERLVLFYSSRIQCAAFGGVRTYDLRIRGQWYTDWANPGRMKCSMCVCSVMFCFWGLVIFSWCRKTYSCLLYLQHIFSGHTFSIQRNYGIICVNPICKCCCRYRVALKGFVCGIFTHGCITGRLQICWVILHTSIHGWGPEKNDKFYIIEK